MGKSEMKVALWTRTNESAISAKPHKQRVYEKTENESKLRIICNLLKISLLQLKIYGERGIRTPGPLRINGFQDRRDRPLCHLSFDD